MGWAATAGAVRRRSRHARMQQQPSAAAPAPHRARWAAEFPVALKAMNNKAACLPASGALTPAWCHGLRKAPGGPRGAVIHHGVLTPVLMPCNLMRAVCLPMGQPMHPDQPTGQGRLSAGLAAAAKAARSCAGKADASARCPAAPPPLPERRSPRPLRRSAVSRCSTSPNTVLRSASQRSAGPDAFTTARRGLIGPRRSLAAAWARIWRPRQQL